MDLEHVNLVVTSPRRSADLLQRLFEWRIRWSGGGLSGDSECIHVGTSDTYVSLAGRPAFVTDKHEYPLDRPGLAHVGVLVDDLDQVEGRVRAEGLETLNHDETKPGRRFYFFDKDGICWEVASYRAPESQPSDGVSRGSQCGRSTT